MSDETTAAEPTTDQSALADEVAKWKALSRKNEERYKEYRALAEKAESETSAAVESARAEISTQIRAEYAPKLVRLAFEAESSGRNVDLDKVMGHLNLDGFVSESGDPDRDAIRGLLDDIAPVKKDDPAPPPVGLFQGARGSTPTATVRPPNPGESTTAYIDALLNGA